MMQSTEVEINQEIKFMVEIAQVVVTSHASTVVKATIEEIFLHMGKNVRSPAGTITSNQCAQLMAMVMDKCEL